MAQSFILPGDFFFEMENQRNLMNDSGSVGIHIGLKPLLNAHYFYGQRIDDYQHKANGVVGKKLFNQDLIELNHTDYQSGWPRKFQLNISPLVHFQGGLDVADSSGEKLFINARGVLIKGRVDKNFYFESAFLENQATLPQYMDDFVQQSKVIPGFGRWKKFKTNGYDYAFSSGYVAYQFNKNFTAQAGHGKHQVGSGYRSLLLSDNAFNYPYLRLNTTFCKGRIQYSNIYALLMNLTKGEVKTPVGTEPLFQKKPAVFHHLSVQVSKRLNVSLFQSLIWTKADSLNRVNLGLGYFNPVIFSNLALYGLQNNNNMAMGLDFKLKTIKNLIVYGQFLVDEIGPRSSISDKYGYQVGFNYADALRVKNLFLGAEFNTVRPFTYSATDPAQSFSHYSQPLAHPLGANFRELVGFVRYTYKRVYFNVKLNVNQQGLNLGNNYGQDIFVSDFAPALNVQAQNQGVQARTTVLDLRLGYLFNPKYNLTIFIGALMREREIDLSQAKEQTEFFYLGLKTSIFNTYWDF